MTKENQNKNYKITDCVLYWCNLHEPSQYSEKYQVNATNLSDSDAKALKKLGLNVNDGKEKGKPEMGLYVVAKAMRPVPVVDSAKNTIEDTSNIGNGSKGNVFISAFDYDHVTGGKGVGCGLQSVQITEFIEYSPAAMFDEVKGGYVQATAATTTSDVDPFKDV